VLWYAYRVISPCIGEVFLLHVRFTNSGVRATLKMWYLCDRIFHIPMMEILEFCISERPRSPSARGQTERVEAFDSFGGTE
jgi:hypothetical protein